MGRDYPLTRYAFDTNILAYIEGVSRGAADTRKVEQARDLADTLDLLTIVLPTQALVELHHVLTRLRRCTPVEATVIVTGWLRTTKTVASSVDTFCQAIDLAAQHRLQIYDAVILASVAGHADILLSEDMQDGFSWNGVTVLDPFIAQNLARLRA